MVTVTSQKSNQKRKGKLRSRWPGIVRDAELLGVTRQHLFYVLKGERKSPPLLRRYRALKAASNPNN